MRVTQRGKVSSTARTPSTSVPRQRIVKGKLPKGSTTKQATKAMNAAQVRHMKIEHIHRSIKGMES